MYVCVCKAVTDSEICRAVAGGVETIEDLCSCLPLGSGCGKCLDAAEAVLRQQLDEQAERQAPERSRWADIPSPLTLSDAIGI
jgi:bacterioferritin-associated ferredoxin